MSFAGLLAGTVGSIVDDWDRTGRAAEDEWAPSLWHVLEEHGLTTVGVPESSGGAGGSLTDGLTIASVLARAAAPVPVAESSLLAGWALAAVGAPVPAGPLAVVPAGSGADVTVLDDGAGWVLDGTAPAVPWARHADHLVVVVRQRSGSAVALAEPGACRIDPRENLAGEPRDDVTFEALRLRPDRVHVALRGRRVGPLGLERRLALIRSVQMAAALEATLASSVDHARNREQFGKPIATFQAVQHQIALLAGEVAAAKAAVDVAVHACGTTNEEAAIAAAKVRVGDAAGTAAAIAHQVHGAVGFTDEHPLHRITRRLWAWRDEGGDESYWAAHLGNAVCRAGSDAVWHLITAT